MKNQDITHPRLCNQRISQTTFVKPADAVGWLVAVQAQDYFGAKWSGVAVADSRVGLEALKDRFGHEGLDGKKYWFPEPTPSGKVASPIAYLLSVFDEYVTSYKDRSAMAGEELTSPFNAMGIALQYVIIIDSQFVGAWKRVLEKDVVIVQLNALIKLGPVGISAIDTQIWTFSRRILQSLKLTQDENQAVVRATRRYGTFLELPVTLRA